MNRYKSSFLLVFLLVIMIGCSKENDRQEFHRTSNIQALGTSANDLLSNEEFSSLHIEVITVPGYEPSHTALANLQEFIDARVYKPGGVELSTKTISSPGGGSYSISDIREIEKEHRMVYNSGTEIAVFIFVADGKSSAQEENAVVLGTAYQNTSIVLYEQAIRDLSETSMVSRSEIESTTLKHEFGHLLGLVDNGSPAQSDHEDPENSAHCSVSGCLMVAAMEFGDGTIDFLKSNQSADLDSNCRLDLRSNGGK